MARLTRAGGGATLVAMGKLSRALVALLLIGPMLGCGEPEPTDDGLADEPEPWFSFVIITDPHVTRANSRLDDLATAVDWINDQRDERRIELVIAVGDLAWGDGLPLALAEMERLTMPWVPFIGDNEVHAGHEQAFYETFEPQYQALASQFDDFAHAPVPVANPGTGEANWLSNLAFGHRGLAFIACDWNARSHTNVVDAETAHLNDFAGGSLGWLEQQLARADGGDADSLILLSHIPMQEGLFDDDEMAAVVALLEPYRQQIYANFAGHMHISYEAEVAIDLFTTYVTAQLVLDPIRMRAVRVDHDGQAYHYTHELLFVERPD